MRNRKNFHTGILVSKDPSEYSFERNVNDLEGLRKDLGIKKWVVIGHSYGGMVAEAYALEFPNSVDKLVLSNTFYDAGNAAKVRSDPKGFNPQVYYRIVGADGDFLIEEDIGKLDFRTELKRLKMPVLIMAGRFDRVSVPRFSVKFREYCPQAKFVMFEKSGHLPFIEQTGKYFRVLEAFLK